MDRPSITDDELAGLPGIYAAGMERRGAVRAPYSGCGFIGDPLEAELEAEVGFVFADETDENLVEEKNWLRKEYEERDRMPEPDENLAKMVAAGDRNGLIAYFMCDVEEMAARYSKDGGPEYMDLLCEGALALTEYVMGQSILRRASLAAGATAAIRRGISRAALAENTERFVVEYDSQKAEEAADCADVDPVGEFDRSDELALMGKDMADALDALPNKRQLGVIMMRLGLGKYETHHTNMQIMERLGYSTPQGVLHAYNSGLRKLKSNSGKKLAMYLDAIGPNRAKGTERASAEEQTSMTELIRRARDDIEASSGKTTREFMKFYNLNMLEFADYLSALYPRMTRRSALQIVRLSEQEKMALKRRGFREYQKFGSLEAMRNTLRVLEKRKADAATAVGEQEMLEKLRDIYSPMFFSDKKKCFEILDREAASDRNPERLRVVFRRLRKYFDEATGMSVRGISTELDDFQKVDIDILSRHNSHIIASEMGTGKSLEAIAYAMKKGMRRILVVSTKSGAYSTWPNELKRHLTHTPSTAVLDGQMFTDRELLDEARNARWFVTTYATAARYIDQLRRMGFDMVVLDESHKVNNASTDQSAALTSLNVPHKLAISGSLFKNRRSELFPVLNWLWPDDFPDQREFEKLYCIKDEGLYLLQYELRRRMILRHKDDVLDIPDVKHITETATLGDSEREYMQMEDNFLEWLKAHESDIRRSHPDAAVLKKLHQLRKKAIEPKVPLIDEIVDAGVSEGRKVVVYTTYIGCAELFRDHYGRHGVCYLDGRSGRMERVAAINDFETDPKKKVFVVTAAGGESIDLTPASDIIYANKPLTHADEKQMLDRLHRRGQNKRVRAFHVTTADTIDERIERLVERKKEEYQRMMGDPKRFALWFEEVESDNTKQLLTEMMESGR